MNVQDLRILLYPDPALRRRGEALSEVTDRVRAVAARMIELMHQAEGIGLAAPQVGMPWRLFVVDLPEDETRSAVADPPTATKGPLVCINPTLADAEGPPEPCEEGCLSLPDIRGDVIRAPIITLNATDPDGKPFTLRAGGLLSRCFQHEYDHLDGVLIIDKMTQMSRMKNRAAIRAMGSEL